MSSPSSILIIGVGNPYRRDDGVGVVIANGLAAKSLNNVTVVEESGEGAALIETWKRAETVFLIDAVATGAAPGTLFRFDAQAQTIPPDFFHYSTHAFSVAEAIELARALRQLPPHLTVYGIEGQNFEAGVGLSTRVQKAALKLTEQIAQDILSLRTREGRLIERT